MTPKNVETPFIRQCVALWLAGHDDPEFTSIRIASDLQDKHPALRDINITKAVSNELIRLEGKHKLGSRKGTSDDWCGNGRPPKLYRKKVKFL